MVELGIEILATLTLLPTDLVETKKPEPNPVCRALVHDVQVRRRCDYEIDSVAAARCSRPCSALNFPTKVGDISNLYGTLILKFWLLLGIQLRAEP